MADYELQKFTNRFYQAGDDEVLFNTLKIEFSKVSKVEALIVGPRQLPVEYAEKSNPQQNSRYPNDPALFRTVAPLRRLMRPMPECFQWNQ